MSTGARLDRPVLRTLQCAALSLGAIWTQFMWCVKQYSTLSSTICNQLIEYYRISMIIHKTTEHCKLSKLSTDLLLFKIFSRSFYWFILDYITWKVKKIIIVLIIHIKFSGFHIKLVFYLLNLIHMMQGVL